MKPNTSCIYFYTKGDSKMGTWPFVGHALNTVDGSFPLIQVLYTQSAVSIIVQLKSIWECWMYSIVTLSRNSLYFAQGHTSHGWLVQSQQNSNLIKTLCLSCLPASMKRLRLRMAEKSWTLFSHYNYKYGNYFSSLKGINSEICSLILMKFELGRDFMTVSITCKYEEDLILEYWPSQVGPHLWPWPLT